jgi:hypothetical protein
MSPARNSLETGREVPATSVFAEIAYWLLLPVRWARQVARNTHDIARVVELVRLRPIEPGLVDLDHPWVTGVDPATGTPIWPHNVVFRTPRSERLAGGPSDEAVLLATGRFLAHRVRQSAEPVEIPRGPERRMPHAINYMHGSSHYNSGIVLFNDLAEGYRHLTDARFRRALVRFVRAERREVLILFRDRNYGPLDYACFSCCLRALFPWFCNPNGPGERVLWGNFAPFPTANLITGHWADDVYALRRPGGAEQVVRPPVEPDRYFTEEGYGCGRSAARWPEVLLAWLTYWRVRLRGVRGGLFFVNRQVVYADVLAARERRGRSTAAQARLRFTWRTFLDGSGS